MFYLQDIVSNMSDGENKLRQVKKQGDKIMPHTNAPGQANLRREMESLTSDWEALVAKMKETQNGLTQGIKCE